jgi:hypothetical protein
VDQNPHLRLSIASVELPDGTRFDQYVARIPRCAMTVVLDEAAAIVSAARDPLGTDASMTSLPDGCANPMARP